MYYKLYSDAAKYPNSNKIGIGILIINNSHQSQNKLIDYASDNHEAEFKACIKALQILQKNTDINQRKNIILNYYTDSKIVAESLNKQYAKHYQKYVDQIINLEAEFNLVFNNWISENKNRGAHNLATQALHEII